MKHIDIEHFLVVVNTVYSRGMNDYIININNCTNAPRSGYMVEVETIASFPNLTSVKTMQVRDILKEKHDGSNASYIGLRNNPVTHEVYFDILKWYESKESALNAARRTSKSFVIDLEKNKVIIV